MAVGISNLPTGVSSITSGITSAANLLLVSPQQTVGYKPQPLQGQTQQPALVFHYEGEQTSTIDSDITDHYAEDNIAIQDQISLKPIMVTTHGFVGELNDVAPIGLQTLQQVAQKLVTIGAYTPGISATAALAYNEAAFAYSTAQNAANAAVSSWQTINNIGGGTAGGENVINGNDIVNNNPTIGFLSGSQTKQQWYYQVFYSYWLTRTLFTIQTPWAIFQNMAIKTLRAVQDAETEVITDFELTFKQLRFVSLNPSSQITTSDNSQGQLQYQTQQAINNGTQTANTTSATTLEGQLGQVA
jgi:hypothetical protein